MTQSAFKHTRLSARVISQILIAHPAYEIVLHAPDIAASARPGQFVMVTTIEDGVELRRPFSIYRASRDSGSISILYLARGSFTSHLAQRSPGDLVELIGPLGNGFSVGEMADEEYLLVGGGVGASPICFFARTLVRNYPELAANERLTVISAARTATLLVGVTELQESGFDVMVVTDDGSAGEQGSATDILILELDRRITSKNAPHKIVVYACGPMPLLRRIAQICLERNVRCQVSIETSMPCGVGECDDCMVPMNLARRTEPFTRACCVGPVYEADELLWEDSDTP